MVQGIYKIIKKDRLNSDCFSFWIDCKEIAQNALPGQFVHIRVPGFQLRRPISICEISASGIRIVIQIRGAGTEVLCSLEPGDEIDLLGSLGSGFPLLSPGAKAVIVGGGIGTPPLLPLAGHYDNAAVFLGFRDAASVILTEDFASAGAEPVVSTDDGSFGERGLITLPLERYLAAERPDVMYACGPLGLLKGIQALSAKYNITSYISLEERMACGVGACLGCAVSIKTENGVLNKRVCKDGPVFNAGEVVL